MRPVPTRRTALVALAVAARRARCSRSTGCGRCSLLANLALLVVVLLDVALAVDPRRLEIERDLPPVIALRGDAASSPGGCGTPPTARCASRWPTSWRPSLRASTRRLRGTVPGRRHAAHRRPRCARAGEAASRSTGWSCGSRARSGSAPASGGSPSPGSSAIHPAFPSREEAELRITRARILEVGLRSAKGRGGGTEFDQLREYGVDDEVRRIDWAATARAGKAMVRTYRAERNQNVLLLLDNGRVMAGQVADVPRVEHAMDALMCLTTVATRLGDRCGLVAFDRTVRAVLPARSGRDQLGRVAEAMFDLEPVLAESDYRGAFTHALARFRRRSLIVLFTDLVEQAVGESLLPALPLLVRHHIVLIAAVRDPDVVGWATASPDDASDAYRATAATLALAERDRAIARLRGLGAIVIDAPPGQLAPRLADTYLELKARGGL